MAAATVWTVPDDASTIQAAIDLAAPGDTILLQPGTYRGPGNRDIELQGKDLVVTSVAGPEQTIIDCEHAGHGFYLREGETRAAVIENLSIWNGEAPEYPHYGGAGIYCNLSSPTIRNCWIRGGSAVYGGGVWVGSSSARIERCWIADNWAENQGGGLWMGFTFGDPAEVVDCVITGNWSYDGGGVLLESGAHGLTGCTVAGNLGTRGGGIITGGYVVLERCIVDGNCAFIDGDEMFVQGADVRCTLIDPAGVFVVGQISYDEFCLSGDPRFCDYQGCGQYFGGDWSLRADSPCLPENSPCGELIGALGQGCGGLPPTGACCLADGSCEVQTEAECEEEQGAYQGDLSLCEPNPCTPTAVETTTWGRIKERFR